MTDILPDPGFDKPASKEATPLPVPATVPALQIADIDTGGQVTLASDADEPEGTVLRWVKLLTQLEEPKVYEDAYLEYSTMHYTHNGSEIILLCVPPGLYSAEHMKEFGFVLCHVRVVHGINDNPTKTEEAEPPKKVKMALVVEFDHMPLNYQQANPQGVHSMPIPPSFWQLYPRLVDRAVCETDESTQQIIPYIVLLDDHYRIFTYSRGSGSGEERLRGDLSIGLGGHVDDVAPKGKTLQQWLEAEAARELEEEAGVVLDHPPEFCALLRDPTNKVGRVHLGVLSVVRVQQSVIKTLEADVIENGQWLTTHQLREDDNYNRLENWSRAALARIMGMVYNHMPLDRASTYSPPKDVS